MRVDQETHLSPLSCHGIVNLAVEEGTVLHLDCFLGVELRKERTGESQLDVVLGGSCLLQPPSAQYLSSHLPPENTATGKLHDVASERPRLIREDEPNLPELFDQVTCSGVSGGVAFLVVDVLVVVNKHHLEDLDHLERDLKANRYKVTISDDEGEPSLHLEANPELEFQVEVKVFVLCFI